METDCHLCNYCQLPGVCPLYSGIVHFYISDAVRSCLTQILVQLHKNAVQVSGNHEVVLQPSEKVSSGLGPEGKGLSGRHPHHSWPQAVISGWSAPCFKHILKLESRSSADSVAVNQGGPRTCLCNAIPGKGSAAGQGSHTRSNRLRSFPWHNRDPLGAKASGYFLPP